MCCSSKRGPRKKSRIASSIAGPTSAALCPPRPVPNSGSTSRFGAKFLAASCCNHVGEFPPERQRHLSDTRTDLPPRPTLRNPCFVHHPATGRCDVLQARLERRRRGQ